MTSKKTAISIEKPLFDEVESLAEEMDISRSQVFSLAAREFIQRRKNQKLLNTINAAYKDLPDVREKTLRTQMKAKHRRLIGRW